jgi:hypothetical protein
MPVRQIIGRQNAHVEEGYEHGPVEDARLQAVAALCYLPRGFLQS